MSTCLPVYLKGVGLSAPLEPLAKNQLEDVSCLDMLLYTRGRNVRGTPGFVNLYFPSNLTTALALAPGHLHKHIRAHEIGSMMISFATSKLPKLSKLPISATENLWFELRTVAQMHIVQR
jgi:hypothetical protein